MPTHHDDIQDDYYANIAQSTESNTTTKTPLKIKPKVVIKKPSDTEPITPEEPASKPKIIMRKVEKSETPPVEEIISTPEVVERPTARLVSREHGGESLLRSVMKKESTNSPLAREQDTTRKPLISFQKATTGFKPLENRPVMQLPPEERR